MTADAGLHVVILTIGATGHINPTLDLSEDLLARGHRVTYLAPGPVGDPISGVGAEHVEYESTLVATSSAAVPPEEFAAWLPFVLLAEADHTLPLLLQHLAALVPDVLVYDRTTYLTARVIADRTALPTVCFFPSFAYNAAFDLIGDLERRTILNPTHEAHRKLSEGLVGLAERWGGTPVPVMDVVRARAEHALVAIPFEFQPRAASFGDEYVFTGAAIKHRLGGGSPSPTDSTGGAFCSLGTAFTDRLEAYQAITEGLRHSAQRGLLVAPDSVSADLRVGAEMRVERWVDQLDALSHAELFITHAGMGSVQEAVRFGVPMICIPSSTEQSAVAARVAELGLGLVLKSKPSASDIAAAVEQVRSDPELRQRCRSWADRHRDSSAGLIGAEALERFVG